MAEGFKERRAKLSSALALIHQLADLNDQAELMDAEMAERNVVQTERESTVDLLFAAAGPPHAGALVECTGSTISDRLINILNGALVDGVDWTSVGS